MDVLEFFKGLNKEELKAYSKIKKGLAEYGEDDLRTFEGAVNTILGNEKEEDEDINPETGVHKSVERYIENRNKSQQNQGKDL